MTFAKAIVAVSLAALGTPLLLDAVGAFDKKLAKNAQAVHVLNRLTFGPRPGDVETVNRIGVAKWIERQLHPERIAENPSLQEKLKPLATLKMSSLEIASAYDRRPMVPPPARAEGKAGPPPRPRDLLTPEQAAAFRNGTPAERLALLQTLRPEIRQQLGRGLANQMQTTETRREAMAQVQPAQVIAFDLVENKLYRALYSERQLEEVLVDFWFNHFNVYFNKGADRYLVTSYERDAIRPNVLGKFKDLLLATARHPAMLFYLDNWQSMGANPLQNLPGRGRRLPPQMQKQLKQPARGLNENYGRELLELHTLGVDGGYKQKDVVEVARAFTGWTILQPRQGGEFRFNPGMHDRGEKVVLNHVIAAGGGEQDGMQVIDILVRHPNTALFISRKLAQRFVADDPPEALVKRMAETFTKTSGDLREVMRIMLTSREFLSEGAYRAKMKSPLEMVVSAARAMNAEATMMFALSQRIDTLGQPLYRKEEPTGYDNTGEGWVNTAGLLGRMNYASALTAGQIPGVKVDLSRFSNKDADAIARELLQSTMSAQTRDAIRKGLEGKQETPALIAGLIFGSPDFQRR
jgi:uncharacterized protein (DUF1800 family)